LALSAIPTFPVPGLPGDMSAAAFVGALNAPLLGPFGGFLYGLVYGVINQYLFAYTAFFGPLTFLTNLAGATTVGLILYPKKKGWIAVAVFYVLMILAWYFYKGNAGLVNVMPIVTWRHWAALILLVLPWTRNFVQNEVAKRDNFVKLIIALWLLEFMSVGNNLTGNVLAFYLLDFTNPVYWVPLTLYYAIMDIASYTVGALVGAPILIALKNANIRIFADTYEEVISNRSEQEEPNVLGS